MLYELFEKDRLLDPLLLIFDISLLSSMSCFVSVIARRLVQPTGWCVFMKRQTS